MTQQAFEASTRRTAKSAMQRCQEREATGGRTPKKIPLFQEASIRASLLFLSSGPFVCFAPWKTSSTQAQGFNFQLPPPALARASRVAYQQSELRQRRHSNWRCTRSEGFNDQEGSSTAGTGTIPLYSGQREASRKAASSQPTPPPSHLYGGATCLASVP